MIAIYHITLYICSSLDHVSVLLDTLIDTFTNTMHCVLLFSSKQGYLLISSDHKFTGCLVTLLTL